MSLHDTPDFIDYDTTGYEFDDDFYEIRCLTCGKRYGDHYGGEDEQAWCKYNLPTGDMFEPDLIPKRPKLMLDDSLFEVE